jgi:hypothetical protein
MVFLFLLSIEWLAAFGQSTGELVFPETYSGNIRDVDQEIAFQLATTPAVPAQFAMKGTKDRNIHYDTIPTSYDEANRRIS